MSRSLFSLLLVMGGGVALADSKSVSLVSNTGEQVEIATLTQGAEGYQLNWKKQAFQDHFLSMRPFKCVPAGQKLWCHVPYPYEISRTIGDGNLTDLEYDLLFVWKDINDYGIDMWNGIYYRLSETDGGFRGTVHEMDMGGLAVPPSPGNLRPISDADIHPAEAASHAFPEVIIE